MQGQWWILWCIVTDFRWYLLEGSMAAAQFPHFCTHPLTPIPPLYSGDCTVVADWYMVTGPYTYSYLTAKIHKKYIIYIYISQPIPQVTASLPNFYKVKLSGANEPFEVASHRNCSLRSNVSCQLWSDHPLYAGFLLEGLMSPSNATDTSQCSQLATDLGSAQLHWWGACD